MEKPWTKAVDSTNSKMLQASQTIDNALLSESTDPQIILLKKAIADKDITAQIILRRSIFDKEMKKLDTPKEVQWRSSITEYIQYHTQHAEVRTFFDGKYEVHPKKPVALSTIETDWGDWGLGVPEAKN
jgi:hypothetical protein